MLARNIPDNAVEIRDDQSDAITYYYTNPKGRPCARVYVGNRPKPIVSCYYVNEAHRAESVKQVVAAHRATLARREANRNARKAWVCEHKVGDIFKSTWGHDQTNVDYYQVVAVAGKRLTLRQIEARREYTGDMEGLSYPYEGAFFGEELRRLAGQDGIKITIFSWAVLITPTIDDTGAKVYPGARFSTYA